METSIKLTYNLQSVLIYYNIYCKLFAENRKLKFYLFPAQKIRSDQQNTKNLQTTKLNSCKN